MSCLVTGNSGRDLTTITSLLRLLLILMLLFYLLLLLLLAVAVVTSGCSSVAWIRRRGRRRARDRGA